jgi:hypothetical protein
MTTYFIPNDSFAVKDVEVICGASTYITIEPGVMKVDADWVKSSNVYDRLSCGIECAKDFEFGADDARMSVLQNDINSSMDLVSVGLNGSTLSGKNYRYVPVAKFLTGNYRIE